MKSNHVLLAGERLGIPLAADAGAALQLGECLARDAGFESVVGGLSRAKEFDHGAPIFCQIPDCG